MSKIKEVSIHKPHGVTTYRVNDALYSFDEKGKKKKLDYQPTEIIVEKDNSTKVKFSNGMTLIFKGFPIVIEI